MVFVLSGSNEYSQIKRLGDLHKGMVTQCVKSQTLTKPNVFRKLEALPSLVLYW
uniref:Transposase n=1 Tax=Mesocestoides corti TaxID=53468 RepID=A0A5K3G1K9_MESCO